MTDKLGPLPYCPGCGHETVVKALDKALVKLQPDPSKVVIVTDIGCIGLSDKYFVTSAFHGLYGRSITYACGLKLARPELTVIAMKGDDGCGIGGTHLLNVARRNIGITLLVANNFNYGMTGDQHSVTTPAGGITSTTPWGNVESPMDLCATAVAAGAAWVYRATGFNKDLSDVIAAAIEQPGFAMLDIWELCTALFASRNKFGRKQIEAYIDDFGFERGLLRENSRPEYSVRCNEVYEKAGRELKEKPRIEPGFPNSITGQTGILIAGSAGQKVRSTATLFAEAGIYAGLNATQKDDYPITMQTGHSVSEIILSPDRIDYTGIDSPEYVLLLSENGLKRIRAKVENLPESCMLFADEALDLPETRARIRRFPFSGMAREIGRLSVAAAAIAVMLVETKMFPVDALAMTIVKFQRPKIARANVNALEAASRMCGNEH